MLERLDPTSMRGAVLGLPVVNPPALGAFRRTSPDDSDSPDLNRIFPGKHTWTNDLIAKTVTAHVLPASSALIDFHLGIWGSAFGYVAYGGDFSDPGVAAASKAMAEAMRFEMVCKERFIGNFPGPAAMTAYAAETLGIPSCIGELGGAGFAREDEEGLDRGDGAGTRERLARHGRDRGSRARAGAAPALRAQGPREPARGWHAPPRCRRRGSVGRSWKANCWRGS